MLTKFQVDIINLRTPAAPRTRRRILLSSTVIILFYFFNATDLTRARPGGRLSAPLRFFGDSEKTAAHSAAKFAIAVPANNLTHFQKYDDPMAPKVTPPGHIK